MKCTTEIVTMKLAKEMPHAAFMQIVDELEEKFHSKQPGFLDTELLYNEKSDEWIMIQHWDSLEQMKAASKNMFNNPITEQFVQSIDPKHIKLLMLPQLGKWGVQEQD